MKGEEVSFESNVRNVRDLVNSLDELILVRMGFKDRGICGDFSTEMVLTLEETKGVA